MNWVSHVFLLIHMSIVIGQDDMCSAFDPDVNIHSIALNKVCAPSYTVHTFTKEHSQSFSSKHIV